MKVQLLDVDEDFFHLAWHWINDKEIKELINAPEISKLEHQMCYENLKNNGSYKVWGLEYINERIGICGLKRITVKEAEYWGYIGIKNLWGKGLGKQIHLLVEEESRKLNLQSLRLQVLKKNKSFVKAL